MEDPDEDGALLGRSARGDRAAFEQLMRRHQSAIFHFLARSLSRAAAEDALQETFIRAYGAADRFRGEGSVRGWLFGIARNEARMSLRKQGSLQEDATPLATLGAEAGWGDGSTPEELAMLLDEHQALEAALKALPAADREILMLRDIHELSGEETARALEISLVSMKSRLHRARLRLLAELKRGGRHGRGA